MKSEYINCKNCKDDCHCRGKDLTPICIAFKPVKTTNADRIRAMTDEELAEFLAWVDFGRNYPGDKTWLDWLKATVEVQDG